MTVPNNTTYPAPPPSTNGTTSSALDRARVEQMLTGGPLTEGYRPTLPLWSQWSTDTVPQFYLLRDIEMMMIHPIVLSALNSYKSGTTGAEFWGGPATDGGPDDPGLPISENPEVEKFVRVHAQRFWQRGVPKLQGGYEYGWIASECLYREESALMCWDDFVQFSPRDVYLLTWKARPVGVRVKQVTQPWNPAVEEKKPAVSFDKPASPGMVDLWLASEDVPAKGVWYAHNPRYNQFYGQSQLLGAWRPWRRLAWKDGAETVVDGGIYRFAYSGPVVGYPDEDFLAPAGSPATTLDSQGNPRRYARDMARMIAEQFKAGAGVGFPTTKYPADMGGGDKWTFKLPESTLNIDGLVNYVKYLIDQIRFGVGVPPELFEASETGSGYSGRAIPVETFMMTQQRLADNLLRMFVEQVIRPLVKWNFGPVPFRVEVKPLLATKQKQQTQGKSGLPATAPGAMSGQQGGMQPPADPLMQGTRSGGLQAPGGGQGAGVFSLDVGLGLDAQGNWHGPTPPGPDWINIGEGPKGGSIWKHEPRGGRQAPADAPPRHSSPRAAEVMKKYEVENPETAALLAEAPDVDPREVTGPYGRRATPQQAQRIINEQRQLAAKRAAAAKPTAPTPSDKAPPLLVQRQGQPTLRDSLKNTYDELKAHYREYQGGMVELPRLYHDVKRLRPGLTPEEFKNELLALEKQRVVDLHIRNEVRDAVEPDKAIRRDDKLYYFVYWRKSPESALSADLPGREDRVDALARMILGMGRAA